jgi:hypothetical protein
MDEYNLWQNSREENHITMRLIIRLFQPDGTQADDWVSYVGKSGQQQSHL